MRRKLLLLCFSLLGLWGIVYCSFRAAGPSTSFQNHYAEVGTPLQVRSIGYPLGTSFSYQWKIDGNLIDCTASSYTPTQDDLEHFLSVTVTPYYGDPVILSMYCSSLPVFYLQAEEKITKASYVPGSLTVQGSSLFSNTDQLYDGAIQIRGRGNSTWDAYPKKPYKIKLDTAADLFGMGSSKHWILLANYADESLMRNKIAYDLSGAMGMPYVESTWVSLVYNGEYAGNYLLCEQIRLEKDRLEITDLADYPKKVVNALVSADVLPPDKQIPLQEFLETDLSWLSTGIFTYEDVSYDLTSYLTLPQLTGGFLLEIDWYYDKPSRFLTNGQPIMFDSPEYAYTNEELMAYTQEYFSAAFEAILNGDTFCSEYQGDLVSYSQLFDIRSLAQYILIQEIFFNYDGVGKSNYLYKDTDSLAYMGPIWDMDWSSGRTSTYRSPEQWWTVYCTAHFEERSWYGQVIKDPYFLSVLKEVWDESREQIMALIEPDGPIQQAYDYLYESGAANEARWPYEDGFSGSVDIFYDWMCERLTWLDRQFTSLDTLVASVGQWSHDPSIHVSFEEGQVSASVPYGATAVLYCNGLRFAEQPISSSLLCWNDPLRDTSAESDLITIRVYGPDGNLMGSNYTIRCD